MQAGATKYNGLRRRDNYDEIVDYLFNRQQKIRWPDRYAKRMRESPYLTQLDGEGMFELRDLEEERLKFQARQNEIQRLARDSADRSAAQLRSDDRQPPPLPPPGDNPEPQDDTQDRLQDFGRAFIEQQQRRRFDFAERNRLNLHLRETRPDAPTVDQGTQPPDGRPPPDAGAVAFQRNRPQRIPPSDEERLQLRQMIIQNSGPPAPPGGGRQFRQPPPPRQRLALSVVPSRNRQYEEPVYTYVNPPPLDPHSGAPRIAAALARGAGNMAIAGLPVTWDLLRGGAILTGHVQRAITDTSRAGLIYGLQTYEQNRDAIHSAAGAAARGAASATLAVGGAIGSAAVGAGGLGYRAVKKGGQLAVDYGPYVAAAGAQVLGAGVGKTKQLAISGASAAAERGRAWHEQRKEQKRDIARRAAIDKK